MEKTKISIKSLEVRENVESTKKEGKFYNCVVATLSNDKEIILSFDKLLCQKLLLAELRK